MAVEEYKLAAWLRVQMRLAEGERTGRGVVCTTTTGVIGPAVVVASRRGMVSLRTVNDRRVSTVTTFRLVEIESCIWAPPVGPVTR